MAERFEYVSINIGDLEDVRHVLRACLNLTAALDIQQAQLNLDLQRQSALNEEIERVSLRLSGALGDHLLAAKDAELEEEALEYEEDTEDAEEDDEDDLEASEELSSSPLGDFSYPTQRSRVIPLSELQERGYELGE